MQKEAPSEMIDEHSDTIDKNWRNTAETLIEPAITENARRVLERRYLKKDDKGRVIETPKEMILRVAKAISSAEKNYGASDEELLEIARKFYDMVASFDFVPNSPTLMNAGRELGQLSACFVLPIGDSIDEIFDAIKYTALIHKSGGGCTSGESRIFTTYCGIERFDALYERLKAQGLTENDFDGRGRWMEVSHLGIRCFSFDQKTGRFDLRNVEKVWNYDISGEECVTVRTSTGISVQTSCWHPFLLLTNSGIISRRADELSRGDRLIIPATDLTNSWPFERNALANGVLLNDAIAWSFGYLLYRSGYDVEDIMDGVDGEGISAVVEDIFEKLLSEGEVDSEEIDALHPREQHFLLRVLCDRLFNRNGADVVLHTISKSSRSVLLSFIAGLIDSIMDHEQNQDIRLTLSDVEFAKDIATVLSILGVVPRTEVEDGIATLCFSDEAAIRLLSLLSDHSRKTAHSAVACPMSNEQEQSYGVAEIVEIITGKSGSNRFYDFTVEGTNNYLAGEFGFAIVHNTGFSFSRLRPAKDFVMSTKGVSSGPLSFMEVFNVATETIKQGGTRRGANMGMLRIDHPDILEFIAAKRDQKRLTNFNISVALTDKFMKAVKEKTKYDLINPRSNRVETQLDANMVFDLIINMAWRNGEPGIVFIDRINRDNPTPEIGQIESTNPCGEQPLLPYESCNLGSIDLSHMLKKDETGWTIDWNKLKETTIWGVRFLDDVIDVNKYPLPQIEEMTQSNRKIGLGIMGFADMLLRLEVEYDSEEALEIARNLMKFIHATAMEASQKLAEARGSFPNFPRSILRKKYPLMRNATVTTIAPTGTISIIAGCSSGIEPLFAIAYTRNVMDKDELFEINPMFEDISRKRGFYSEELMREIAARGSISDIPEIPDDIKRIFITSHDITPEVHVRMQAAFQEFTDNAVSKTVNFPQSATPENVRTVYLMAYDLDLKGVTVYRYGSRDEQVLSLGKTNGNNDDSASAEKKSGGETSSWRSPRPRPSVTIGTTNKMETGCGKLYVTINEDEHGLCEVFTQMGKSGGCTASQSEAIGRLISLALRSGIDVKTVVKQLRGIRCPSPLWQPGGMILSCSDAIAKALEGYVESKEMPKQSAGQIAVGKKNHVDKGDVCPECPECGALVDYVEGCVVCRSCGYSRCW